MGLALTIANAWACGSNSARPSSLLAQVLHFWDTADIFAAVDPSKLTCWLVGVAMTGPSIPAFT